MTGDTSKCLEVYNEHNQVCPFYKALMEDSCIAKPQEEVDAYLSRINRGG
jgi:hypothetical protein